MLSMKENLDLNSWILSFIMFGERRSFIPILRVSWPSETDFLHNLTALDSVTEFIIHIPANPLLRNKLLRSSPIYTKKNFGVIATLLECKEFGLNGLNTPTPWISHGTLWSMVLAQKLFHFFSTPQSTAYPHLTSLNYLNTQLEVHANYVKPYNVLLSILLLVANTPWNLVDILGDMIQC